MDAASDVLNPADAAHRSGNGALALSVLGVLVGAAGLVLRLTNLAHFAFWNDEAWVAISSRVHGVEQFLMSLSVTPILWAALLRVFDLLPFASETSLRLLPLAFAGATMWLAWRLGTRLAGHRLGGLLALAVLALDPVSIAWARQLKPYTAEAALALLALLEADAVLERGGRADVIRFALVLTLGTSLSNAQLLMAPPLLATLAGHALAMRDRTRLRRLVLAIVAVGLWDLMWFLSFVQPWLGAMRDYWHGHFPPRSDPASLIAFVRAGASQLLVPGLGPHALALTVAGLVALSATPGARWTVVALLALTVELLGLSAAGRFPFDVQRIALFFSTCLYAATAAGVASFTLRLWAHRRLRPVAAAILAGVLVLVARGYPWPLTPATAPEDLGPLVRTMERERRPGDRILLFGRSVFVWAYYRDAPPSLLRAAPRLMGGFVVAVDDADVVVVQPRDVATAVARAFDGAHRVWFVGSRMNQTEESSVVSALVQRGNVVRSERRVRALLLLLEPRSTPITAPR